MLNPEQIFSADELREWGIVDWGYTETAEAGSFPIFEQWVGAGGHGPLNYLKDHRMAMRQSLTHYFPKFQSSLVFLFTYLPSKKSLEQFYREDASGNGARIAGYALGFEGEDYHQKMGAILKIMGERMKAVDSDLEWAPTLDIHPVLERDLAYRAGLGWFGKNSMLISRQHGSYVMIGSLLLSKKLQVEAKSMDTDHCGQCRACIDACPTAAIDVDTRTVSSSLCLSTFTIELFKEADPPAGFEKGQSEIFGCDICQDVCPWNLKLLEAPVTGHPSPETRTPSSVRERIVDFFLRRPFTDVYAELMSMSNSGFRKIFAGTALSRTGRVGLMKNLLPHLPKAK